ncbi:hypothetical protein [Flavobacterium columnare]|nr:hypothetical protein [Flavobacterium columnare]
MRRNLFIEVSFTSFIVKNNLLFRFRSSIRNEFVLSIDFGYNHYLREME